LSKSLILKTIMYLRSWRTTSAITKLLQVIRSTPMRYSESCKAWTCLLTASAGLIQVTASASTTDELIGEIRCRGTLTVLFASAQFMRSVANGAWYFSWHLES